ncbi:unnamed protein product, partial [Musa acuminata subsp. burmannicoides]
GCLAFSLTYSNSAGWAAAQFLPVRLNSSRSLDLGTGVGVVLHQTIFGVVLSPPFAAAVIRPTADALATNGTGGRRCRLILLLIRVSMD